MNNSNKNYINNITAHVRECVAKLDQLSLKLKKQGLSSLEYTASERLLQVLIMAAIGVAKQLCYKHQLTTSSNAYDNFSALAKAKRIDDDDLPEWKRIIGFRNSLVHEYLTIQSQVISRIIKNQTYQTILDFIEKSRESWSE